MLDSRDRFRDYDERHPAVSLDAILCFSFGVVVGIILEIGVIRFNEWMQRRGLDR